MKGYAAGEWAATGLLSLRAREEENGPSPVGEKGRLGLACYLFFVLFFFCFANSYSCLKQNKESNNFKNFL